MTRRKLALIGVFIILGVVLAACQPLGFGMASKEPVERGGELLADDFSDPRSGWDTWEKETSSAAYTGGGLLLRVKDANRDYITRAHRSFQDVDLYVSAVKLSGTDNNDFGMVCRYQDAENFYALLVSSDGYAGIIKVKDGARSLISGETMQYSDLIKQGTAGNRLRAVCLGSSLALFVNDTILLVAEDADFSKGDVGLIAGGYEEGGVEIFFDDFKALQP
ncbi:hypothetical protein ADN00_07195 [Ornatilinea apprima]|uniref:3-keto-disaccharide hydrolase domain-containing protein n=1 Tax=Ornatilinea apprima TaxID=1134406 RepID=A0A0P6X864_9CHLR|nr:hypothetical protein [Ornatilinea apprima]KPL78249.1 hypothetical protein ADN00_07195 [Ornatilinea apprima]